MLYNYLSSKLNQDMAIAIINQVYTDMKNDIEHLWKKYNERRTYIRKAEHFATQPLQHCARFDRVATRFGLSSTAEIQSARLHAETMELRFKENLKKCENVLVVNTAFNELADAINGLMDTMDDKHDMFMDIVNGYSTDF